MKKFFKFIGILFLVLIVALVGGGYYFIKNFDLNKYKSYAEDLVYKETGRKLALRRGRFGNFGGARLWF